MSTLWQALSPDHRPCPSSRSLSSSHGDSGTCTLPQAGRQLPELGCGVLFAAPRLPRAAGSSPGGLCATMRWGSLGHSHQGISTTFSPPAGKLPTCPPGLSALPYICLPFSLANSPLGSRRGGLSIPSSCLTRTFPASEPPATHAMHGARLGNTISWRRTKDISIYYFQNIIPVTNTRMCSHHVKSQ